jgi:hypothetical protein
MKKKQKNSYAWCDILCLIRNYIQTETIFDKTTLFLGLPAKVGSQQDRQFL